MRSEQHAGDAHRARLRLDAHEKRIAQLESDAGIVNDDDALLKTWRRPPGRSG